MGGECPSFVPSVQFRMAQLRMALDRILLEITQIIQNLLIICSGIRLSVYYNFLGGFKKTLHTYTEKKTPTHNRRTRATRGCNSGKNEASN